MRSEDQPLEDGVYLRLPEAEYFAQPRIGSTDLAKLWRRGRGWWWQSPFNPRRKASESKALTFGKALHARLLEGRPAMLDRFMVGPRQSDYPGVLVTIDDIREALSRAGHPAPGAKAKKPDFLEYARLYLPQAPVWENILEAFDLRRAGREIITSDEAWEIELMASLAAEEENLVAVMQATDGVPLTEVSVLWTHPECGTRLRFRFDSILPDGNVDLKSIAGSYGSFPEQVERRIREYDLEVQMAQSMEARRAAYRLIRKGKIFGGRPEERAWLRKFPKHAPIDAGGKAGWAWLWIFYQRPDDKGDAPIILPARETFGGDVHREGYRKLHVGLTVYREAVKRFGLDMPWTQIMPTHAFSGATERVLKLPPWNFAPLRQPGEDEALDWRS